MICARLPWSWRGMAIESAKNIGSGETLRINGLRFSFPGYEPGSQFIDDFSLTLNRGDRCLLVGSNGAGKTTILRILGGKHMVSPHMVHVLGRSAFHDTSLTTSGDLCFLGGEWRRDVAFAGFEVPIQMDISAEKMIFGVLGIDPARRERLIELLDIDLSWRMNKASDGQRRRVQICMGLLKPFKVLLLDEITVDLDILARTDLLMFLKEECNERGATIVYATHIFDGLDDWPSHIVYMADGRLKTEISIEKVKEATTSLSLMRIVESWLRKERDEKKKTEKEKGEKMVKKVEINNGWASGRLHSTMAGEEFMFSSNSVIRH